MNVLQVLVGAGARAGGPPPFVGGTATELGARGVNVRTLATDLALAPWGWIQQQRRIRADELHPSLAGTDVRMFAARFPRRLAYSPRLAAELRETASSFDVVHIHNLWQFPQYAAHRACRDQGVPYIVSPHGGFDPFLRNHGRARKWIMSRLWQDAMLGGAHAIHVTTEAERELIADIAPRVPRVIVPCGLYVDEFTGLPSRERFRRERLGGYDGPLVLFLGRVTKKKGLEVLIEALGRLRPRIAARLAVVGPDDEGLLPRLRRLVTELGLDAEVSFIEPLYGEERLAALAAADVWALSSHAENFGIALVEAMAAGCPVAISSAVNLAPDVEAAGAGVVAPADPAAFAEALRSLLADEQRRARLSDAGREFAARYDWGVVAPQLLDMYASVAASPAGTRA